jgi:putative oxidoreductase
MLTRITEHRFWKSQGVVIARILMGGAFLMAAYTKFTDMGQTAMYITSAGFPAPLALAWIAAIFETVCGLALVFGAYFRQAALLLGVYTVFLAFAFHGPSHWNGNPNELGSFVDHFTMLAGLLFMAAYGPGDMWVFGKREQQGS